MQVQGASKALSRFLYEFQRVPCNDEDTRYSDIPNLDSINQLENIHSHQDLRTDDQYIPECDLRPSRIRIIQHGIAERHVDKGVHRGHQDDQFGSPSDVMIHKASPIDLIQLCVSRAVEAFQQEGFDDVLFYEEEDDEDDGEREGGVGR